MTDIETRRRLIDLPVKELADRAGVPYPRVWRHLRNHLKPGEIERLDAALSYAERERGVFISDIGDAATGS